MTLSSVMDSTLRDDPATPEKDKKLTLPVPPKQRSVSLAQMVEESNNMPGLNKFDDSKLDRQNILQLKSNPTIRNKLNSLKVKDRFQKSPESALDQVKKQFKSRNLNARTTDQRAFSIADSEIQHASDLGFHELKHINSKQSFDSNNEVFSMKNQRPF